MNLPWILGALGFVAFFAAFETLAFKWPTRFNTLSRFVFNLGQNWPLSIFLIGFICGGLAVHFYWHWCPDVGAGLGLLSGAR